MIAPTPPGAFDWLHASHARRRAAGLERTLRPRAADVQLIDLAGNDYLGLARHPEVTSAAAEAAARWGAGATGSRLVTGSTGLHARLEVELAEFCGFQSALVFSSGYTANLAAVTALTAAPGALIVSDAHNHASLIDGCRLSRARVEIAAHADPSAFAKALDTARHEPAPAAAPALAVTDAVFSVDGDAAPLTPLAELCRARPHTGLLIDDAHGLGVLGEGGRGTAHAFGLAGAPGLVATVTLSKSLGSQGGAVLGPAAVIRELTSAARTFVFDTALAPPAAAAALAALRLLRREPGRPARVRDHARALYEALSAAGLGPVRRPEAAVVSVPAPTPDAAVAWAAACRRAGLSVGCFRPPSVPDGIPRLRLTARADLSPTELAGAVKVITSTAPH
ncbi:aminotransferase class I/II-fold pyridoxal phosphate-dependent enzyme [Phaeacidiphilus oryzae]|uniref:aminotransferase class I/II-fold pyridoxal phosphate-dependent enzyme n=1 Tax=Phaeacidiphilus oryzae TaxID=348818 RepID=UPI00055EB594|nr:aminotransferase class I/II-fold pyridoxal phosphate-dependent enzyme [Phaeacidiphilus oryzae]